MATHCVERPRTLAAAIPQSGALGSLRVGLERAGERASSQPGAAQNQVLQNRLLLQQTILVRLLLAAAGVPRGGVHVQIGVHDESHGYQKHVPCRVRPQLDGKLG